MRPGGILFVIKKVEGEPTILQATLLLLHPITSDKVFVELHYVFLFFFPIWLLYLSCFLSKSLSSI